MSQKHILANKCTNFELFSNACFTVVSKVTIHFKIFNANSMLSMLHTGLANRWTFRTVHVVCYLGFSIGCLVFLAGIHHTTCRQKTRSKVEGAGYVYFIRQPGVPYWEKLCPRSRLLLEAVGRGQYSRQSAQFFPIRIDLALWTAFLFFSNTARNSCQNNPNDLGL